MIRCEIHLPHTGRSSRHVILWAKFDVRPRVLLTLKAQDNREYVVDIDDQIDLRPRGQVRYHVRHGYMRRVKGVDVLERLDGRHGVVDVRRTVRRCPDMTDWKVGATGGLSFSTG